MIKRKYGYHSEMKCEHCEHCIKIAKAEDFDTRKSYVDTSRINMYLNGMNIKETEEYLANQYTDGDWYVYSRDIPTSKEQFEKFNNKLQYKETIK